MSVTEPATVERKRTPRRAKRSTSRAQRPRSAVTSGRQLFISGDPNSAWSRRYHDLVVGHCNDIGPGPDLLSEAQLSLIRRAASIECELERLDAMLSAGAEVNLDAYGRAASHLRRLFEVLGLERKARDVTVDGVEIEVFSPMRQRWAEEAQRAAKAAKEGAITE
jgi:hypothetical protein